MSTYEALLRELGKVKLIGVSKTQTVDAIRALYHQGLRSFGENKVQELLLKQPQLPQDIEWHMIGHLQTNKIKALLPVVSLIHGVDSLKILREIQKEAAKINRCIPVLLQMHIASEETKFGLSTLELFEILEYYTANPENFHCIKICGLMGMASFTEDTVVVRKEFAQLRNIFESVKKSYLLSYPEFIELSMGMSNDYRIAIEEGSTMVRIGSKLFGTRIY